MQKYDVAIIGGGASGLACAVTLKKYAPELSVLVIEAGDRLGKKLAATGNGQGNLKNADMGREHFHGSGADFAFGLCGKYDHLQLLDCLFVTDGKGRIYPAGKQASSLSDCLIKNIDRSGVKVIKSTKVTDIRKGFALSLSDGRKLSADKVVIAAGGCAQKQFNTDGNAFTLAKSLGHTVTEIYPSLVQLKCGTKYIKTLKGIRAECRLTAFEGGELLASTVGDVIFTDYGISGNAVFYISAYCAGRQNVTLSLEFLPSIDREEIVADVKRKLDLGYARSELLAGTLHNQIGRAVVSRAETDDPLKIADLVKNFTLETSGSLGFDYAQVTKGGVPFSEIDETLQSKIVEGLYLIGEVLDVDGDCGGYNLSWAFASGMHAAKSIIEAADD